jgi:hypothetical protein
LFFYNQFLCNLTLIVAVNQLSLASSNCCGK